MISVMFGAKEWTYLQPKVKSFDFPKFKARLHTGMRTVEDTTNVSNVEKSLELEDEAEKSGLGDNDSRGGVDR